MPGNQTNVLPNVHITRTFVLCPSSMPSDATVHNTWRLPREQRIMMTRDLNLN
jgi:hypothetical protein